MSPTKDFHSRIGIFKSCRYSTDSRIICLGAWSKYITKSPYLHFCFELLALKMTSKIKHIIALFLMNGI